MKFEVIESRAWVHTSGRTASVYGACPWVAESDRANWSVVSRGWTVRNPFTGEVGACRKPFATQAEAEAFADSKRPAPT